MHILAYLPPDSRPTWSFLPLTKFNIILQLFYFPLRSQVFPRFFHLHFSPQLPPFEPRPEFFHPLSQISWNRLLLPWSDLSPSFFTLHYFFFPPPFSPCTIHLSPFLFHNISPPPLDSDISSPNLQTFLLLLPQTFLSPPSNLPSPLPHTFFPMPQTFLPPALLPFPALEG